MKDTNCKNVEREIDVLILIIMEDTHGDGIPDLWKGLCKS